jgi:hypothetical protein
VVTVVVATLVLFDLRQSVKPGFVVVSGLALLCWLGGWSSGSTLCRRRPSWFPLRSWVGRSSLWRLLSLRNWLRSGAWLWWRWWPDIWINRRRLLKVPIVRHKVVFNTLSPCKWLLPSIPSCRRPSILRIRNLDRELSLCAFRHLLLSTSRRPILKPIHCLYQTRDSPHLFLYISSHLFPLLFVACTGLCVNRSNDLLKLL